MSGLQRVQRVHAVMQEAISRHPELNLGDADEQAVYPAGDQLDPKRPKAGR
jgi:hypothetical protein